MYGSNSRPDISVRFENRVDFVFPCTCMIARFWDELAKRLDESYDEGASAGVAASEGSTDVGVVMLWDVR